VSAGRKPKRRRGKMTLEQEFDFMQQFVTIFNPENKPQSISIEFDNFGSSGLTQKTYSLYIEHTANALKAKSLSKALYFFIAELDAHKNKPQSVQPAPPETTGRRERRKNANY
jgi:hypothetical protein